MAPLLFMGLLVAGILGPSARAVARSDRQADDVAQSALEYFAAAPNADFDALLRRLHRPAPSAVDRAAIIASLPEEGALRPTLRELEKLKRLSPVKAFHARETDIEIRVIAVDGLAVAGLHARTVVLISREALAILGDHELLAIVAHEFGHDYLWDEYEAARRLDDARRLQELELRCDGISLITLDRLGIDPRNLASAVTKLARYNERLKGAPTDRRYVPLNERVRFIRSMVALIHTSPRDAQRPAVRRDRRRRRRVSEGRRIPTSRLQ